MLLLNVQSSRYLREGDEVRVLAGPRSGHLGKVVGFSLDEAPVVVQYPRPRGGVVRDWMGANDVAVRRVSERDALEPLPNIPKLLQDGKIRPKFRTCGVMISVTLGESATNLTVVPKDPGVVLGRALQARLSEGIPFEDALRDTIAEGYVTRLPHLVQFRLSKTIDDLLEAEISAERAVDSLLDNGGF